MTRQRDRNWLIIGFGNEISGDDAFGPAVIEELRRQLPQLSISVDLISTRLPGPELAEKIAASTGVIFVDAAADIEPGALLCLDLHTADEPAAARAGRGRASAFSHYCQPQSLVGLAETLYEWRGPAFLLMAGSNNFEIGSSISRTLSDQILSAAEKILAVLKEAETP
ncbi:MAG: hydrogenase maturation protease [Cyanobacteria bacterium SZAS TMP-1]|nr:hydrogenase maturation protease [Cyanobacteria bacterium SZAS TMP-1]